MWARAVAAGMLFFSALPPAFAVTHNGSPIVIRPVRVLVADGLTSAAIRASGTLSIAGLAGASGNPATTDNEIQLRAAPTGLQIDDERWPHNDILIEAAGGPLTLVTAAGPSGTIETAFSGRLRIISGDQLQVINEVDLEEYVASVVASEIWPNFEIEAYRAQAIVTRTYVLYHMLRRSGTLYDVAATQGSQVYRGIRDDAVGKMAAQAAHYTKGLVCAWGDKGQERIFCTYYSAACGGMSQSAAPLGAESDIPPLAGGVRCEFCRGAPGQTYRWGPVRLPLAEVFARLSQKYPDLTGLRSLRNLEPGELTRFGRPLTLRLTGASDAQHEMLAERFRLAVAPNLIKSTDCNVKIDGADVVFEDGKGYGHGLGLCQWGMQGQALGGRKAAEILRYYFPGSHLVRVY